MKKYFKSETQNRKIGGCETKLTKLRNGIQAKVISSDEHEILRYPKESRFN